MSPYPQSTLLTSSDTTQVVRIAKSKGTIAPDDEGFGLESVRDDITRIVDLIDPIDRCVPIIFLHTSLEF